MQRALESDQVRLEVVAYGDLADRRADRGQPHPIRGKDSACLLETVIVKIEHVGVPRAAELDEVNTKAVQRLALDLQVRGDLVGESGKGPHGQAPVAWTIFVAVSYTHLRAHE